MNPGTNEFPILVTDVNGAGVTGLVASDFTIQGAVGGVTITSATLSETSGSGYYVLSASIPVGQGYIAATPISATSHFVTPTFYDIDVSDIYSTDDIYTSLARQQLDATSTAINIYEAQTIGPFKQGDAVVLDYVVPNSVAPSISGYTDFKASVWSDSILTSVSGSEGYIGEFTLTVDIPTKSIKMVLDASLTANLVSEGLTQEYYYSDLQAVTPEGYKKTLAELTILFKRQFTRS